MALLEHLAPERLELQGGAPLACAAEHVHHFAEGAHAHAAHAARQPIQRRRDDGAETFARRLAADREGLECLPRIEHEQPVLRERASEASCVWRNATSVLWCRNQQRSLAGVQTGAEEATDHLEEDGFVLVEVNEMTAVPRRGEECVGPGGAGATNGDDVRHREGCAAFVARPAVSSTPPADARVAAGTPRA